MSELSVNMPVVRKPTLISNLISNVRLFWQGALLSYVAMFAWLEPTVYIASKVLLPLAQILFFSFLGMYATNSQDPTFYVIGNAIQMVAINGIYGVTMSIGGDRWNGTLAYLFGTPANRLSLFVGRATMHVIDGALGAAMGLLWGVLVLRLDLSHANLPILALTILVTTFSTSALGLLLGCLSLVTLNVMFINNTVYFLLLIFSGANLDISMQPAWIQTISQLLPLTRGIAAARGVIAGKGWDEVAPLIGGEFLMGLIYVFIGYTFFRWFEFQAKRRGTLETM
ncbi:MAG: ABC transporter permease [Anaerolineae bacterium]|nr:ABC transporter permease [Anaerolineae bacterium]